MTGDSKYLERAQQVIDNLEKYCKVKNGGYAGLINVDDISATRQLIDDTPSFWFGEMLKYLWVDFYFFPSLENQSQFISFLRARYLTFDDPKHISLDECKFFSITDWSSLMEHSCG